MGHDRRFIDRDISDDACGRAIFGLGVAAASTAPRHITDGARELFAKTTSFRSRWPHAMAYAALGAAAVLADDPDQPHAAELLHDAATMIQQATGRRHWPEARLRYANALLPECLLAAGSDAQRHQIRADGLAAARVARRRGDRARGSLQLHADPWLDRRRTAAGVRPATDRGGCHGRRRGAGVHRDRRGPTGPTWRSGPPSGSPVETTSAPPCSTIEPAVASTDCRSTGPTSTRAPSRPSRSSPRSVGRSRWLSPRHPSHDRRRAAGATRDDSAELFVRHPGNPIITPGDVPGMVNAVFNPGATVFEGETLLLMRVEDRTGRSNLMVARSPDGYDNWTVDPDRGMFASTSSFEEHSGIEDPRITRVGDEYFIVYTGYSSDGPLVMLASTRDFVHFERHGILQSPDDKDAALFPVRFDGRWALIHRPTPHTPESERTSGYRGARICATSATRRSCSRPVTADGGTPTRWAWASADADRRRLAHLLPRRPYHRVGRALPCRPRPARPRRPDPSDRPRQRMGVRSIGVATNASGDVPDVVFPSGWILDDDGDTIRMYYGARRQRRVPRHGQPRGAAGPCHDPPLRRRRIVPPSPAWPSASAIDGGYLIPVRKVLIDTSKESSHTSRS